MSHSPCPFDGYLRAVVSADRVETTVRCTYCQKIDVLEHARRWEWDQ